MVVFMIMTTYTGGCHCKKVRYEVNLELSDVLECNCSHCQIKGLLLAFVPAGDFTLLSGEDSLTEYRFNKLVLRHLFCEDCGVQSFSYGEKDGVSMVGINVRTIDDVELSDLNRVPFDGKSY
jgi:hypothetical protein